MKFEKKTGKNFGKKVGFVLMYFVFTTILYFILKLTDKLEKWNYIHIALITLFIILLGTLIKSLLK